MKKTKTIKKRSTIQVKQKHLGKLAIACGVVSCLNPSVIILVNIVPFCIGIYLIGLGINLCANNYAPDKKFFTKTSSSVLSASTILIIVSFVVIPLVIAGWMLGVELCFSNSHIEPYATKELIRNICVALALVYYVVQIIMAFVLNAAARSSKRAKV